MHRFKAAVVFVLFVLFVHFCRLFALEPEIFIRTAHEKYRGSLLQGSSLLTSAMALQLQVHLHPPENVSIHCVTFEGKMAAIIDTTLREGEQTPGVRFSVSEKKTIIDGLSRIGIEEIELGIASPLIDCTKELIRYCRNKHPHITTSLWSRCKEGDIRHAAHLKPDIIALSIPASDLLIEKKLGKDRQWVEKTLGNSMQVAGKLGLAVSVGLEDAGRADRSFLLHLAALAETHEACRIRLADTIGTCSPMQIRRLIGDTRKKLRRSKLCIHTHNDFGMASANALTALQCGADFADASILGLGERSGCARLEELAAYLSLQMSSSYDMTALAPLSRYVSGLTGRAISSARPLLGEDIFTCETGLHLQALQNAPETYEPYPPDIVGLQRKLIIGEKTGRKALSQYLKTRGISLEADMNDEKMRKIRHLMKEGPLSPEDLAAQTASKEK